LKRVYIFIFGFLLLITHRSFAQECRKIVDLTQQVDESSPYWPGGVPFKRDKVADYGKSGFRMYVFHMGENVGTHLDAPSHFISGGRTIELISPHELVADGVVIDIEGKVVKNPDYALSEKDIQEWETKHGQIPPNSFVIVNSGWWRRWVDIYLYRNRDKANVMHFPGVSEIAARFLVSKRDIRGIGIDTLSLDPGNSKYFGAHKVILGAGKYIIENLTNLNELPPKGFKVYIGVMKVRGGTQAPARVIATVKCK
jgi:kynurenine formamidase